MKKTLFLALCLLLALACLSALAEAAKRETFTSGDFTYALLDDGTAEIIRYSGSAESLDIPAELDGRAATAIGDYAFYGCADNLILTVGRNSYAREYCVENGIVFNYPDSNDWLKD